MSKDIQLKCPFCQELNSIVVVVVERREYLIEPNDGFEENPTWFQTLYLNGEPEIVREEGFRCEKCERALAHRDILIIENAGGE